MAGGIVIAIILLLFPLVVTMSTSLIAAMLGTLLYRDAAARNDGSELLETNY